MNLQPSFWDGGAPGRYPGDPGSPVDVVMAKSSFTLEEILDQDDVIQECKYLNSDLVDYLSRPDIVERLVKYTVESADLAEEIEEKGDEFLMGKYSFIASELLVVENMQILDAMFNHPKVLEDLFGFLKRPTPLDATVTSYFRKVVVSLIQRKFAALMRFLRSQRDIVARLVEHIGLYSIMEVLIMIGWDDGLGQIRQYADVQWLYTEGVMPKLLSRLDPKYEGEQDVHTNAARALVDVVAKCPADQSNLLVTHLQSASMLKALFGHMFSGSRSSLTNALSVAIQLVQKSSMQEEYAAEVEDRDPFLLSPLAQHVSANMDRLFQLIVEPPETGPLDTQYGRLDPPLGETRIKGVEMFVVLYGSHYGQIHRQLVERRVLDRILDLFFRYKWNNMLHSLVESVVLAIVESETDEVKVSAFRDSRLAERLVDAYEENAANENKPRCFRYGYMGHVIRVCNGLAAVEDPLIDEYLGGNQRWADFVRDRLSVDNERQSTVIGGHRPNPDEVDSDEDEFAQYAAAAAGGGAGGGAASGVGGGDGGGGDDDDDDDDDDEDGGGADGAGGGAEGGPRSLSEMIQGFITDEFEEEADWEGGGGEAWTVGGAAKGGVGVVGAYPGSSSSEEDDDDSSSSSGGSTGSSSEDDDEDDDEDDEEEERRRAAKKAARRAKAKAAAAADGSSEEDSDDEEEEEDDDEFVVHSAAAASNLQAVARMYAEADEDDGSEEKEKDGGAGVGDESKADEPAAASSADGDDGASAAFNDRQFWRPTFGDSLELDEDI